MGDYPELREQWHARQYAATREEALEWLEELGIEVVKHAERINEFTPRSSALRMTPRSRAVIGSRD